MQIITTITLLAVTAFTAVAAEKQMQINYYSDSSCHNYQGQTDVTWATPLYGKKDNCYNYNYGNSVNIANCYKPSCQCNFFYQKDCQGTASTKAFGSGNCIGGANQLKSFACYYN